MLVSKSILHYQETSDALFHQSRFEDLPPNEGQAGYLVHCKATGTIEAQGKILILIIATGYGVHERILNAGIVLPRIDYMKGRGLNWAHGWSGEFSWYIMSGMWAPRAKVMSASVENCWLFRELTKPR
jgi:hypothetical protein